MSRKSLQAFMNLRVICPIACLIVGGVAIVLPTSAPKDKKKKIEFNRDIRPILSEKCFACHGHDPKALRANLDLNIRDKATGKLGDGHTAIVPDHPELSEMIARINAGEDERMPPV